MIKVYGTPNCLGCEQTKNEFKKLGIPFEYIDVTKGDRTNVEYVLSLGYQSVPVVVAETETWAGFQPAKIKACG